MLKKHQVTLTVLERAELAALRAGGTTEVRKLKHAQALLRADEAGGGVGNGPSWCDTQIEGRRGWSGGLAHRPRRQAGA